MKGKVVRGRGFHGLLKYLLDRPHAELISGTVRGRSSSEVAARLGATRRLRPDVEKPVWHYSLSLPADEFLSSERWHDLTDWMTEQIAREENVDPKALRWCAVRHSDTEYDHVHIVLSRITDDSEIAYGRHEARKLIRLTQRAEHEFNLTPTPGLDGGGSSPSTAEHNLSKRGIRPVKSDVRAAVDEALQVAEQSSDDPFRDFATALLERNVRPVPSVSPRKRTVTGMRFAVEGDGEEWNFKGSQLGKSYSWSKLKERIGFDPHDEQHQRLIDDLSDGGAGVRNEPSSRTIGGMISEQAGLKPEREGGVMSQFKEWCKRYGYELDSAEARRDWDRARANLDALERAVARHDAREAIERAREQSREPDEPDDDLDDAPDGPR